MTDTDTPPAVADASPTHRDPVSAHRHSRIFELSERFALVLLLVLVTVFSRSCQRARRSSRPC
jgi:hypothetical protein